MRTRKGEFLGSGPDTSSYPPPWVWEREHGRLLSLGEGVDTEKGLVGHETLAKYQMVIIWEAHVGGSAVKNLPAMPRQQD